MIKSCEDITTLDDFYEFARSWHNAREMGLRETISMLSWGERNIISPKLFSTLTSYE